jgi:HK97 family phage major capsid protein
MKKRIFYALAILAMVLCAAFLGTEGAYTAAFAIPAIAAPFVKGDKFEEKSADELAKMDVETLSAYFNALNAYKTAKHESEMAGKADKSELDTLKAAFDTERMNALENQLKTLNGVLEAQGIALKKFSAKEMSEKPSLKSQLEKAKSDLTALKEGDKTKRVVFDIDHKAADVMLLDTNVTGTFPAPQYLAGLNTIASRRVRLMDIVQRGTATSNLIRWVYQANKDGAAGGTEEGATKNLIDFDLVVGEQSVVKRTALIKVSDEMVDDIDFMMSEIRNELMRELMKDVEATAYSGNNTPPAMNGVYTVATTFAAGTFALSVHEPNEADVLVVAMNQIKLANQDAPNYILMNPSDVTKLRLIKKDDEDYINRLQVIAGTLFLDGVQIVETTLVTAGQFLVGDFTRATLFSKGGVSVEIGFSGEDFEKNLRTIRAEFRGAMVVKNNDRTAFVKGVFSTAKAAIAKT